MLCCLTVEKPASRARARQSSQNASSAYLRIRIYVYNATSSFESTLVRPVQSVEVVMPTLIHPLTRLAALWSGAVSDHCVRPRIGAEHPGSNQDAIGSVAVHNHGGPRLDRRAASRTRSAGASPRSAPVDVHEHRGALAFGRARVKGVLLRPLRLSVAGVFVHYETSCIVPEDPGCVVRGARRITPEDVDQLREQHIARMIAESRARGRREDLRHARD